MQTIPSSNDQTQPAIDKTPKYKKQKKSKKKIKLYDLLNPIYNLLPLHNTARTHPSFLWPKYTSVNLLGRVDVPTDCDLLAIAKALMLFYYDYEYTALSDARSPPLGATCTAVRTATVALGALGGAARPFHQSHNNSLTKKNAIYCRP